MTRGGSDHSCTHHGGRRSFPLCLLASGLEKGLASVIGHADRAGPLETYCMGLILPAERKSVEPMAALTAPTRITHGAKNYRPRGSATENRTSHPKLDRNNETSPDRRARQPSAPMSLLYHSHQKASVPYGCWRMRRAVKTNTAPAATGMLRGRGVSCASRQLARMLARVRIPIIEIFHARNRRPTRTMSATRSTTSARRSEPCGNPAVPGMTSVDAIVSASMSTFPLLLYAGSPKARYRGPHRARARHEIGDSPQGRISRGCRAARVCSAVVGACHPGPPPDHAGVRGLPLGVAGRRKRG